jgi:26S proteasome non-ATPase regulatory subunit 10
MSCKLSYDDQVGCTPLHRAASTGNSELCEFLIEEGADVDAVDRAGQTPLMNAVICYNKEVCLFYFSIDSFTILNDFVCKIRIYLCIN